MVDKSVTAELMSSLETLAQGTHVNNRHACCATALSNAVCSVFATDVQERLHVLKKIHQAVMR